MPIRGMLLFLILFNCAVPVLANGNQDCVILLHGLARTADSLSVLEHHLEKEGFNVVNIDYPSRKKRIEQLSIETVGKKNPAGFVYCCFYLGHNLPHVHLHHHHSPRP